MPEDFGDKTERVESLISENRALRAELDALRSSDGALRASVLESLFSSAPTGMGIVELLEGDLRILVMNEVAAKDCGLRADECGGMLLSQFCTQPYFANLWLTEYAKCVRQGRSHSFEYHYDLPHGKEYRLVTVAPVPVLVGETQRCVFTMQDVTASRSNEAIARRLLQALDGAPDFVCIADVRGRPIYANKAAKRLLGIPDDSPVQHLRPTRFLPKSAFKEIVRTVAPNAIRDGTAVSNVILRNWKGEEIPCSHAIVAGFGDDGSLEFFVSIVRDLTDVKRAEAELHESRERYRLAVTGANDGIWDSIFKDGKTFFSSRYKEILGYDDSEFCDSIDTWAQHVHPDDLQSALNHTRDYLNKTIPNYEIEYRMRHKDGSYRMILDRGAAIWDENGSPIRMAGSHSDITERKQIEQQLKASRSFIEKIANTAPTIIFTLDLENESVQYVNDSIESILGYSQSAVLEMKRSFLKQVFHHEDIHLILNALQELVGLSDTEILSSEVKAISSVGSIVWLRTFCRVFSRTPEGQVDQVLCTAFDITESKLAVEALRESEQRYELAVAGSQNGLWDWQLESGKVFRSKRYKEMLGYAENEIGEGIDEYRNRVHPDDFSKAMDASNAYASGKSKNYEVEERLLHRDGTYRWFLSRGVALRDATGVPYRFAGSSVDITDRKVAEEQLRVSEARLSESQSIARIGSWEIDVDNNSMSWSLEHFRLFGFDPSETSASVELFESRLVGSDKESWQQAREIGALSGKQFELDVRIALDDGNLRHYHVIGRPVVDESGNVRYLRGTTHDLTERKLMEHQLELASDEAVRASKLKSEFLANMSHEIRTPMNGIVGIVDLLRELCSDKETLSLIDTLQSSAHSLLSILSDVLDFSKIEAGKLEIEKIDFDLVKLCNETFQMFEISGNQKNLHIEKEISADLSNSYVGDPGRIRQAISNLLGNAIKFTKVGSVKLDVELIEKSRSSHKLRFSVVDTGIGITDAQKEKVFQSFTQADGSTTRHFGGTGLGLTITRQLVELMDGHIGFDSQEGLGSRFWFTLTLQTRNIRTLEQSQHETKSSKITVGTMSFQHVNVLVAEDNAVNQRVITKILERFGCAVTIAEDGNSAAKEATINPPDIVLMDIQMPNSDGFEATQAMRKFQDESKIRFPIIAMTAHAMFGDRDKCLEAGMDDYMSKPITVEMVESILAKWVPLVESIKVASEQTMDWTRLFEAAGGDEVFASAVINEFIESSASALSKLTAEVAAGHTAGALETAHLLKGMCSTLGAEQCAVLARHVESCLEQGQPPSESASTDFRTALDKSHNEAQRLLASWPSGS